MGTGVQRSIFLGVKTERHVAFADADAPAVEHVVEALIPDPWVRDLLEINSAEPCLALYRKTWVGDLIVTYSVFYSPGSRYTLGSRFVPQNGGVIDVS